MGSPKVPSPNRSPVLHPSVPSTLRRKLALPAAPQPGGGTPEIVPASDSTTVHAAQPLNTRAVGTRSPESPNARAPKGRGETAQPRLTVADVRTQSRARAKTAAFAPAAGTPAGEPAAAASAAPPARKLERALAMRRPPALEGAPLNALPHASPSPSRATRSRFGHLITRARGVGAEAVHTITRALTRPPAARTFTFPKSLVRLARAARGALKRSPTQKPRAESPLQTMFARTSAARLRKAGDALSLIVPDLSPRAATALLTQLKFQSKHDRAHGRDPRESQRFEPAQTGLAHPLIVHPEGAFELVLKEQRDAQGGYAVNKSAFIEFSPKKITIAELTPVVEKDALGATAAEQRAAAHLSQMSRDLSPEQAGLLVLAAVQLHDTALREGVPSEPRVFKARETGLARTLQHNPDGTIAIWLRDHVGNGGQKTIKRAALIRFDERGNYTIHSAVKAAFPMGKDGLVYNQDYRWEDASNRIMQGAEQVVQMHVGFERWVPTATGNKGKHVQIQDFYDGGDLSRRLNAGPPLTRAEQTQFGRDILAGLTEVHARGLMHLDVKPMNTFLKSDGRAIVADLGLARQETDDAARKMLGGTTDYYAPEFVTQRNAGNVWRTQKEDVFAAGIILHRIEFGTKPFFMAHPWNVRDAVVIPANMESAGLGPRPNENTMRNLIAEMLSPNPDARPTMAEALARFDAIVQARDGSPRT